MGSSTVLPLYTPPPPPLTQGCSTYVCFDFVPRSWVGGVGFEGGVVWLCWRTLRCMAMVKADWTKDILRGKLEGVKL